jgi:U5 snRNP spliceosome subunit
VANWQPPRDEVPVYPSTPADNPYAAGAPQYGGYPAPLGYGYPPPGYGYPPPPGYGYPPPPGYGYPPPGFGDTVVPPDERRPGTLLASAVLGYVNAGLLILAGILLFDGASLVHDIDQQSGLSHDSVTTELVLDGFANLIAAGLLIAGSVLMTGGRPPGRAVYSVGGGIVIVESIYWMARWADELPYLIVYALLFAALAVVGLALAWTAGGTAWLRRTQPANAGSLNR